MFIQVTKNEMQDLITKKLVQQISRWESLDKASLFYSKMDGIFTGYHQDLKRLKSAYSTPVVVFKIKATD